LSLARGRSAAKGESSLKFRPRQSRQEEQCAVRWPQKRWGAGDRRLGRAAPGTIGKSPPTIDKSAAIAEFEAAGFEKVAEGNFLRQPGERRDQPYGVMENTADQVALKFRKPP